MNLLSIPSTNFSAYPCAAAMNPPIFCAASFPLQAARKAGTTKDDRFTVLAID